MRVSPRSGGPARSRRRPPPPTTLSDSTPPDIGIETHDRTRSATSSLTPAVSEPSTKHTFSGHSASNSVDGPSAARPTRWNPAADNRSAASPAVPTLRIGARNATPADALTTMGSIEATPRLGTTTPSIPAAVAVRRIIPTFAGVVIPSRSSTRRRATSSSASTSGRIRGATTSAKTPWS